jgi:hypothetical protein
MIQLRYIRPSIWIPSCELAWSSLVIAEAGAKDVKIGCIIFSPLGDSKTHASRLYVLRFLLVSLSHVPFQDILPYSAVGMLKANWERE